MIGATKSDHFVASGMVSRQTHSLHDCLCTRHVKRDLVHARDGYESTDVVDDHWMVRAQYRTEISHQICTLIDTLFVKVIAEQVDAIRPGQIVKLVSIKIGQGDTRARCQKGCDLQPPIHHRLKLKWRAIGTHKLQVGQALGCSPGLAAADGETGFVGINQSLQRCPTTRHDIVRRVIDIEHLGFAVRVARQQRGHSARDARMACQRPVFGHRKLDSLAHLNQGPKKSDANPSVQRQGGQCQCFIHVDSLS